MLSEEELKARVEIDKDNLDEEVSQHPQLLLEVHDLLTNETSRRERIKLELRTLEAELTFKHRKRYVRMEEKTTDKIISLEVARDEEYISLNRRLLKQSKRCQSLQGLKESYQARGHGLAQEVKLWLEGYWASNSTVGKRAERDEFEYDMNRKKMADRRRQRERVRGSRNSRK